MLHRAQSDEIDSREQRAQRQVRDYRHERLTNPDGSTRVVRIGEPRHNVGDLYHFLMTSRWWQFIGAMFVTYIGVNFVFALAYSLVIDEIVNCTTLLEAFFFSVQTMASIGYGHVVPIGRAANLIVTIEAFIGMLSVAIGAGLVFARFTRPQAGVMFSKVAVVTVHDGQLMLMFRLANRRRTHINQASVTVVMAYDDTTAEGENTRRLADINLRRTMSPTFVLSWTIRHVIDEYEPALQGKPPSSWPRRAPRSWWCSPDSTRASTRPSMRVTPMASRTSTGTTSWPIFSPSITTAGARWTSRVSTLRSRIIGRVDQRGRTRQSPSPIDASTASTRSSALIMAFSARNATALASVVIRIGDRAAPEHIVDGDQTARPDPSRGRPRNRDRNWSCRRR